MPKSLTQYRVFIASPGSLKEEREGFRKKLQNFTAVHSEPRGVHFYPVGWEETLGGVGRPQELINEDLKQCDYAVFVLHDRWGTPTGGGHTSGTEEEWLLAERLYKEAKVRNIVLFFKDVDSRQLRDPGEQLRKVIDFKEKIQADKKYLFKAYAETDEFCEALEGHLAKWLRDHETAASGTPSGSLATAAPAAVPTRPLTPSAPPGFDYWIAEADKLLDAEPANNEAYIGALFCAERALAAAGSDIEWAHAKNLVGAAQLQLKNPADALAAFAEIPERFESAEDEQRRLWLAKALHNKGVTLGQLGRSEEAITVYDDVVARFGTATELPLREQVAKALFNKGVGLGQLGRSEEAITVYDDVVARFGAAEDSALQTLVERARRLKRTTN